MPISGPPPKDPSRRARRNKGALDTTWLTVMSDPAPQPELPRGFEWHSRTRAWWRVWGEAPQAAYFATTDWQSMLTTALIHSAFWSSGGSDTKLAAELRSREALVGGTPADRAKLRMVLAQAEEAEDRNEVRATAKARSRRAGLKALPEPPAQALGD